MHNRHIFIEFLLLLVAFIWASNFSVAKISMEEIDPMSFNAMRFLLATLLMWVVIYWKGKWKPVLKKDYGHMILLGFTGNLIYQLLFIFGLDYTFSANAAVMLGTVPVWVAVISHFFYDEQMNRNKAIGVILAFSGVLLILLGKPEQISMSSKTFVGDLLTLMSALMFGYYSVHSKKLLNYYPPMQLTTITMTIGGIGLMIAGLPWIINLDFSGVSKLAYGGTVYSGLFSIGVAFLIWNYGLKQVGAVRTATYQNLVPVLGLILGFIVLGEKLGFIQYLGSAVVISGIIQTRRR
jgi:drug/metabolite transporter (DMT)-like permease